MHNDLQAPVDAGRFGYEVDQVGILYAPAGHDFTFWPRRGFLPTTKGNTEALTAETLPHALWHSTVMRLNPDVAYYAWGSEIMLVSERAEAGVVTWSASVGGWRMTWAGGDAAPAVTLDKAGLRDGADPAFDHSGALLRWRRVVAFILRCRAERAAGVERPVTAAERCAERERVLMAAMPAGLSLAEEHAYRHGVELRAWQKDGAAA